MVRLRIQLLGSFQVSLDGAPLTQFGANIARALLAYLAMNAGKHIPREIAASLLWPEHDQARALHNLRQALTRLRTVLGDQGAHEPFLQITRETLCFCPQSPHWLDVAAFKERVTAARDHPHRDLATCPACVQQLEEAAALYGGSFLAGFYIDSIPSKNGSSSSASACTAWRWMSFTAWPKSNATGTISTRHGAGQQHTGG